MFTKRRVHTFQTRHCTVIKNSTSYAMQQIDDKHFIAMFPNFDSDVLYVSSIIQTTQ